MTQKKRVIVFFARDFLSRWFSEVGKNLEEFQRLYIVTSVEEELQVKKCDTKCIVYNLSNKKYLKPASINDSLLSYNKDRFLRWESKEVSSQSIWPCINIANEIKSHYQVDIYVDEPVANFPNHYFNETFKLMGATILHFQTSWVPGYGFFCSDASQLEKVKLNHISDGQELMQKHVENRNKGEGLPLYVFSYNKFYERFYDMVKIFLKGLIKKYSRKHRYYLQRSHGADFYHAKCLFGSFFGGYSSVSYLENNDSKYVIFPMHYEPEQVLTYFSKYSRQTEVVSQILDSLPIGYELIVKEHPSQPGALNTSIWKEIRKSKRIHKIFGTDSLNSILSKNGTAVVSFGSTMALEAVFNGAKCAVFSDVHFSKAPGVTKIEHVVDWINCLNQDEVSRNDLITWYSKFLDDYCMNDIPMSNNKTNGKFEKIIRSLSS